MRKPEYTHCGNIKSQCLILDFIKPLLPTFQLYDVENTFDKVTQLAI